ASATTADPGLTDVDAFLSVHADGTVSLATGRVELGQGTTTGLLLIAAEELGLPLERFHVVRHDTDVTPNTGGTYGSSSIALAGPRVRSAAATARQALAQLGTRPLGLTMASPTLAPGEAPAKPVADYSLVGIARMPRVDIPAKVAGT